MTDRAPHSARLPRSLGALLFALALATGCATLDARMVRLGAARRALAPTAQVTLHRPPVSALRGRELALIEVTTYDELTTLDRVLPTMREMARSVGASVLVWLGEYHSRGFFRVIASAIAPE